MIYSHKKFNSILDIGPYPGAFAKMIRDFFGPNVRYLSVGLGLSEQYKKAIEELNGKCIESELDPDFIGSKSTTEWPFNDVDGCIFLDAIEHLSNPIYCLDQINKSLNMGGFLIVTTDNITALGYVANMLISGDSPNVPPIRSSLFYKGDWRPHFKEFSKKELHFFLNYCGFEITSHEYFERMQGDFYMSDKNFIYRQNRYKGLKGFIVKAVVDLIPHLRDHQILVAKKSIHYSDIIKSRPSSTDDMQEWLSMRENYHL
jgi:hypothetical protein